MSSHHPYHHPPRLGIIFFCCCIRCHYSAIDVSECHLERIAYSFSLVSLHFTTTSTSAVAAGCLRTQKSFAFSLVGAARVAVVIHTYITTQQFSSLLFFSDLPIALLSFHHCHSLYKNIYKHRKTLKKCYACVGRVITVIHSTKLGKQTNGRIISKLYHLCYHFYTFTFLQIFKRTNIQIQRML